MGEMPTQPSSGSGAPAASNSTPQSLNPSTMQHAIALQQFQFQQSLVSQQLTHAVSIKAAAEQAAARAAEISSRLLKGEKTDPKKEKAEPPSPNREKSKSRSQASSPSPSQSSRSKSISPIRYRHSRSERERYSPREHRNYRGRRYLSYYGRGRDDYRSNYRRNADRLRGRGYSYYPSSSTSRRKRRSPSRSWSPRYRRGQSPSPPYRRVRSPSPKSNHRKSARGLARQSLSRSPIGSSSLSPSPAPAKVRGHRRSTDRRSLSSSRSSPSCSTTSLLKKGNRGALGGSRSEDNSASDAVFTRREKEATSSRKQLRSDHSSSSARSESSSIDHSGEKNIGEPNLKITVVRKCASGGGGRAGSSTSSGRETVPKASGSGASDNESEPMHIQDNMFNRRDDDDKCGGLGRIKNGHKLSNSTVKRLDEDPLKLLSTDNHSLSEDAACHRGREHNTVDEKDNTGANNLVDKEKLPSRSTTIKNFKLNNRHGKELPQSSNEELPYSLATETDSGMEAKHCRNGSKDITVEDIAFDSVGTVKQGPSNQEDNTYGYPSVAIGHGHYVSHEDEFKSEQGYDVEATVMLPDGFTWEDNGRDSGSPTSSQSTKKRSKQRSRSKERRSKHSSRHRKRRRKEESEEDFDSKKEGRQVSKLKKHRKKAHRRREKSYKERKRGTRKHRATSSSSSEDSSSFDGDYTDVAPSKRSTGHKKKGGHRSPSAVSSSSK